MSCYSCGTQFGVFKKEHGCKNCGFSCCSKCIHDKAIPVPKKNNKKYSVCIKCYDVLTGRVADKPLQYDVPEAHLKRVAALKEKESGHHSSSASGSKAKVEPLPPHIRKLDKADRDIALRLERLRESDTPKEKLTNKDISDRLSHLRGANPAAETKPTYQPTKRKPEAIQVDELLDEICAEVEIDSHAPDPVKEVEAGLAHLRKGDETQKPEEKVDNNLNKEKDDPGARKSYTKNIETGMEEDKGDLDDVNKLLEAAARDVELDAARELEGMKKDKELMEKLRKIQEEREKNKDPNEAGETTSETENRMYSESDLEDSDGDEEAAAKRVMERYLAEKQIDEKVNTDNDNKSTSESKGKTKKNIETVDVKMKPSNLNPPSKSEPVDSDYVDDDELPYCCICTEDAVLRCHECGLDLYCNSCFRECHKEMGILDHKTSPYKPPKGHR